MSDIQPETNPELRAAYEAEKAGREADAAELAELRAFREQQTKAEAFKTANIAVADGPGKLLYETYAGELTTEAITAQATAYGITAAPPLPPAGQSPEQFQQLAQIQGQTVDPNAVPPGQPVPPAPTAEQLAQQQAMERLRAGDPLPNQEQLVDPDPKMTGLVAFREQLGEGRPRDVAGEEFFGRLIDGAVAGHPNVIHNEREWAEVRRAAGHIG